MAGRTGVRSTLTNFLSSPSIDQVNQVFNTFPKRINFQDNALPGQMSRAALVVFISGETETRLSIGGANNGWKRVDYSIVVQIFHHSMHRASESAMEDFDTLVDAVKTRLRSDHNFGDSTSSLVWQGAEPVIGASYGEPSSTDGGATETFAELQFEITEMTQA